MANSNSTTAARAQGSFFEGLQTSEKKEFWKLVPGSNLYLSKKELQSITVCKMVVCKADTPDEYKKIIIETDNSDVTYWMTPDKHTAERYDHNESIDPALLIRYKRANTKTGEVIDRVRVHTRSYEEKVAQEVTSPEKAWEPPF